MAQRMIHTARMLAGRPKDARKTIYTLLENQDCRSCGKCCQEKGEFALVLLNEEPNFKRVMDGILGAKVDRNPLTTKISFDSRCSLQSIDDNRCSIYNERPLVCRSFPFLSSAGIVALSSACPDIQRLKDNGIEFLYAADFSIGLCDALADIDSYPANTRKMLARLNEKRSGMPEGVFGIPLLFDALGGMAALLNHLSSFGIDIGILEDTNRSEVYFPIF